MLFFLESSMRYGLTEKQLHVILGVLASVPEIECALLFGSRALGRHKKASDIDIAIKGPQITGKITAQVSSMMEDTYLPFFVDIVHYDSISDDDLRKNIDQDGIVIYQV